MNVIYQKKYMQYLKYNPVYVAQYFSRNPFLLKIFAFILVHILADIVTYVRCFAKYVYI